MRLQKLNSIVFHWRKITNGSVNRQIFGAAIAVGTGTALVKGSAVIKELVVAWKFGTGDSLDAFLIALLVPSFIINVIAGSVPAALIPTYIQVRENKGQKESNKLLSGVILWSLILLPVTAIFMIAIAPSYLPLIAKGFNQEKLNLTFKLLCLLSPVVVLSGIIDIWSSVLNAGGKFFFAAISPMTTSIVTIGLLIGFKSLGVFNLPTGLISGGVLEIILLGIALHKQGISLYPRLYSFDSNLRQVLSQYLPMVAGSLLMCSTSIVDQSMAAMLSPGSVAALNYGNRVISLPITLATTALSAAIIPYFSKMVAHQEWKSISHTLQKYLQIIFALTIPLAILFIFFSQQVVEILFQRGSFTAQDTKIVANIQVYYAIQIPFYVANILVVRLISAMKKNHILMQVSAFNLIFNIVFNYIFMQFMGINGIALSTSCVYIFCFFYMFFNAKIRLQKVT